MAERVKNPPAIRESWVQSLGWEDPLEKGTATHCSILAWRIPWTEEPGRLVYGVTKSRMRLSEFHFHFLSLIILDNRLCPCICTYPEADNKFKDLELGPCFPVYYLCIWVAFS